MIKHACDACGIDLTDYTPKWMGEVIPLIGGASIELIWKETAEGPDLCRSCMIKVIHDPKHSMRAV